MGRREKIGVGLMGLGVVGGAVAKTLVEKDEVLGKQVGCPLRLRRALDRDPARVHSAKINPHLFTTDAQEIITDPEIDIVVEVIGGENPALEYIEQSILEGKHVVTANKEVMAKHGINLLRLAESHGVNLLYEASVGAGIPLIAPFKQNLIANDISTIYAIINGTTNYILTNMAKEGISFSSALKQAQELGYAEANPANDIEGIDATYKLAILATLAFHTPIYPQDIYHEGITHLTWLDFRYAEELGYAIKLLAIAKETNGAIEVRVHPTFVPQDSILAKVDGVFNAVEVEGDLAGKVLFHGKGAGASPASSAVLSDIVDIAKKINMGVSSEPELRFGAPKTIKPISEIEIRYYLRMNVTDRPGVLAQISKTLGDHLISISSVIQKESDEQTQSAEIVIMTHPARESAMQKALKEMDKLPVVKEIVSFIRVEA